MHPPGAFTWYKRYCDFKFCASWGQCQHTNFVCHTPTKLCSLRAFWIIVPLRWAQVIVCQADSDPDPIQFVYAPQTCGDASELCHPLCIGLELFVRLFQIH
jgi:hypothetical protein